MNTPSDSRLRSPVSIIGAGLAGSLMGIYLAQQNFPVEIFERRPDMRSSEIGGGRSINLALSARGIHALKETGIADDIMRIAIPMRGRMIHGATGELVFQRYGKDDSEALYATSRAELNKALMTAAEKYNTLRFHFNRRCIGVNFEAGAVRFLNEETREEIVHTTQTIIAVDGASSAVRNEMVSKGISQFSLDYLNYGYKELTIPPASNGRHPIEKNALHIWPRKTFMLIAHPNLDGSFTCTLFFPHSGPESFESLTTPADVNSFFLQHFPDIVNLIPELTKEYFSNPTGSMVTVKGLRWHAGGKVLLLGDAAHAIVPFFGQGMNCAFEDCSHLIQLIGRQTTRMASNEVDWNKVFTEFESNRKKDTDAIADLAAENFLEMRDHVAEPKFQLKKKVEHILEERHPGRFVPKYTMVTFRRVPYSLAYARGVVQEGILNELCANITDLEHVDLQKADLFIRTRLDYLESTPGAEIRRKK